MVKQPDFLEDRVPKLYFKYLAPSISATLVTSIYILADTIMIGRGAGAIGIAALNILLPLFNLFFGTGVLFGVGGSVLFSVSRGRGDERSARGFFSASMAMALFFSVLYMVVFQVFFDPVVMALGCNEGMKKEVYDYGRILVVGAPAFLFSSCLQAFVRNDKAPKLAMFAVISGGVLNVILDYIFIFPMKMGIAGASLATVISSFITVVILITHFFHISNSLKFTKKIELQKIGKVLVNGSSSFLIEMTSGVVIFLFNRQLLQYVGDLGVVVYGIVSNSALVVSSVSNGIGQAVQPIMAVNFGAGKRKRVEETKNLGLVTAICSGTLFTIAGVIEPLWLIQAFVEPTDAIISLGIPAIRIYFVSFLAVGANVLLSTYFQSILRPGAAMAVSLFRGMVFNGILVMLLPVFIGVNGIWLTMPVTEFLTLSIAGFLVWHEKAGNKQEW